METSLVNAMSREKVLKQYLDTVKKEYDYILLDCMPSLGMLTVNTPRRGGRRYHTGADAVPFGQGHGAAFADGRQGAPPDQPKAENRGGSS